MSGLGEPAEKNLNAKHWLAQRASLSQRLFKSAGRAHAFIWSFGRFGRVRAAPAHRGA